MEESAAAATVNIDGRLVGPGQPTYVIAEAGSNHDGDLSLARELIAAAVDAGCDAVKFQVFRAEKLMVRGGPTAAYLEDRVGDGGLFKLFQKMAIDRDWLPELASVCAREGIHFLATPFDAAAVAELADAGSPALKNASSELWHLPLIETQARTGLPLIMSTGMASLEDVRSAVRTATGAGATGICLLQCTVSYPTPAHQVNLAAIETLRAEFGCPVGLSDHTTGIWAPIAAVARGSDLIEKHITLDRGRDGPDHQFAIEPTELREMVSGIRQAEVAIGSGVKERLPVEEEIYRLGRRNLVLVRDLPAGHVLGPDDLDVLRSPLGIAPARRDEVLGRALVTAVRAYETLQEEHLA